MTILPPPPPDVSSCRLYTRLLALSSATDGLAERVSTFVSTVKPMLDLIIAGPFREYTLHSPDHAKRLVQLVEFVIHPATFDDLTPLELAVLIMACYLHDLGMCLTSKERADILSDPRFEEDIRKWPKLWDDLVATRVLMKNASGTHQFTLEARLFQLQEAGLVHFLRPRHATRERYTELLTQITDATGRRDLFALNGVSFEDLLVSICMSHNLDVGVLIEASGAYDDRFPRALPVGGININAQFCAAVLRVVDILDCDRERTPRILFESLGIEDRDVPGSTVTLKEWNRHMAVHSLDIGDDEIVLYADSHHPAIERSIRDLCLDIEREVRDTIAVTRKNPERILARYKFRLPVTVRAQIRSVGYAYKDLAFRLEESAIAKLLMGESLYFNKSTALRELIQNAVDACRVRAMVDRRSGYLPQVDVSTETDEEDRTWLVVVDNGIGMDESVMSRFFFAVGTSYYTSPEFERLSRSSPETFVPISRFGIGMLSVFMFADKLEVHTRNSFSPRGDTSFRIVRVESRYGLAFLTEDATGPQGTKVRVRLIQRSSELAQSFLSRTATYIRETVRRPGVPVAVDLPPRRFEIKPGEFITLKGDAGQRLEQLGIEAVVVDVARWSERLTGRVILFFSRTDDRLLSNRLGTKIDKGTVLRQFITQYHGNRVTVNGISMSLSKLGRVLGVKERRLFGAIDVELRGEADVKYDVARNRLVGEGGGIARRELRKAIVTGLHDLGIADRLDAVGRLALDRPREKKAFKPVEDEEVLSAVLREIPTGKWPFTLHREIAERLELPEGLVFQAIATLLESGRLKRAPR